MRESYLDAWTVEPADQRSAAAGASRAHHQEVAAEEPLHRCMKLKHAASKKGELGQGLVTNHVVAPIEYSIYVVEAKLCSCVYGQTPGR
jgi:hypothetical protein